MPETPEPPDFEQIFAAAAAKANMDVPDFPNANSFEEFALGQHVFYSCYRKAGFSTAQSLYLVAVGLAGFPGPPPEHTNEQVD
jgi:hypothetical protein